MKLTLCLLAAFVATALAPAPAGATGTTSPPLMMCPMGQKATPVYDANGKLISWVCMKR
ncbi:hypothetical protein [Lysobacter silvisoli]|uniref:hypothetical protein n=1 Tax=Lysobacter silvisoli TaxID=2293254 RepID=UPI00131466C8|nr:hypothetical protein [Lysobacter silvisoli]